MMNDDTAMLSHFERLLRRAILAERSPEVEAELRKALVSIKATQRNSKLPEALHEPIPLDHTEAFMAWFGGRIGSWRGPENGPEADSGMPGHP